MRATYYSRNHIILLSVADRRELEDTLASITTTMLNVVNAFDQLLTSNLRNGNKQRTIQDLEELIIDLNRWSIAHIIAVFVRESRIHAGLESRLDIHRSSLGLDQLERDPSQVSHFCVKFHSAIKCIKLMGPSTSKTEDINKDYIRCAKHQQNIRNNNRHNQLQVLEQSAIQNNTDSITNVIKAFDSNLPTQLHYVLIIEDASYQNPENMNLKMMYTSALVEVYKPKSTASLTNDIYSMTHIIPHKIKYTSRSRTIGSRRIYSLTHIQYSVYVVPIDETVPIQDREMYINNTADFETYNKLYNLDQET